MEQPINSPHTKTNALEPKIKKQNETDKKIPPGFSVNKPYKGNPLPLFIIILLVLPYIKASQINAQSEDNTLNILMKESDTILDILSSIHPYLDSESQNGINMIFGLFETTDMLNSLAQSTYKAPHILSSIDQPIDHRERALGIIKSIQPYITEDNQMLTNKIIETHNAVETLTRKLKRYRQQDDNIHDSKEKGISRLTEIIDTIKVLTPTGQQQSLNQISKVLKMVEVMEAVQLLDGVKKPESSIISMDKKVDTPEAEKSPEVKESMSTDQISNTLKTMLNPEQSKSLDLIMAMAQMLSPDSEENKTAD